jgi:histidinol-phosphate aminotransferase
MSQYVRANIRAMSGYVPGEQPRAGSYIKLNTNENPYPPSPRVFEALREWSTGDRLRKYPDPEGTTFRQTAARILGVEAEAILIGNGSDDILTIITRAFVPEGGLIASLTPSYSLYRSLAEIQGARFRAVPFAADWQLPHPWPIRDANLTFICNPNSPSGTAVEPAVLEHRISSVSGQIVIDEAYVDFAAGHALGLAHCENIIVSRSLSKSHALAGIRFGYAVAKPNLVRQLVKVKDSYNCDVLSLAAATAAFEDQDYLLSTRAKIIETRGRLARSLEGLGFNVCPSQANFLWCRRTDRPVKQIYEELKRRMILVRYMCYEDYGDGLRISVGTNEEIDRLLEELGRIL